MAALLFVRGLVLLQQGWAWRQSKRALLTEGPLLPGGASGASAAGGLLMFGDSRIAMWEPRPVRSVVEWRVGYPGETAALGNEIAAEVTADAILEQDLLPVGQR